MESGKLELQARMAGGNHVMVHVGIAGDDVVVARMGVTAQTLIVLMGVCPPQATHDVHGPRLQKDIIRSRMLVMGGPGRILTSRGANGSLVAVTSRGGTRARPHELET